jgi:hypothetical protein
VQRNYEEGVVLLRFFLNTRRHQRKQKKRRATIMQLQVSQGHVLKKKSICGNCMYNNIIIGLSVCRPQRKKEKRKKGCTTYIYYTRTTTTSARPPPTQKKKKKNLKKIERTKK